MPSNRPPTAGSCRGRWATCLRCFGGGERPLPVQHSCTGGATRCGSRCSFCSRHGPGPQSRCTGSRFRTGFLSGQPTLLCSFERGHRPGALLRIPLRPTGRCAPTADCPRHGGMHTRRARRAAGRNTECTACWMLQELWEWQREFPSRFAGTAGGEDCSGGAQSACLGNGGEKRSRESAPVLQLLWSSRLTVVST